MISARTLLSLTLSCLVAAGAARLAQARTWTDATGKYSIEADLIARNDEMAVLERRDDRKLVSVKIAELSKEDQQYLESKDYAESDRSAVSLHDWTLRNGLKVRGRVVGYGRRELVLQWRGGKLLVNDRQFENLPEVYQRMLPRIVGHFTNRDMDRPEKLKAWMEANRGKPQRFTCDGVMLELENGDRYGVPFFFFSEEDLRLLKPGWERWLAAEAHSEGQTREDLYVESQAAAYQRNEAVNNQIAHMQLGLLATIAGVVDLWEVYLTPASGRGWPVSVIVPARDSRQAINAALAQNPGYVAGPARKVN